MMYHFLYNNITDLYICQTNRCQTVLSLELIANHLKGKHNAVRLHVTNTLEHLKSAKGKARPLNASEVSTKEQFNKLLDEKKFVPNQPIIPQICGLPVASVPQCLNCGFVSASTDTMKKHSASEHKTADKNEYVMIKAHPIFGGNKRIFIPFVVNVHRSETDLQASSSHRESALQHTMENYYNWDHSSTYGHKKCDASTTTDLEQMNPLLSELRFDETLVDNKLSRVQCFGFIRWNPGEDSPKLRRLLLNYISAAMHTFRSNKFIGTQHFLGEPLRITLLPATINRYSYELTKWLSFFIRYSTYLKKENLSPMVVEKLSGFLLLRDIISNSNDLGQITYSNTAHITKLLHNLFLEYLFSDSNLQNNLAVLYVACVSICVVQRVNLPDGEEPQDNVLRFSSAGDISHNFAALKYLSKCVLINDIYTSPTLRSTNSLFPNIKLPTNSLKEKDDKFKWFDDCTLYHKDNPLKYYLFCLRKTFSVSGSSDPKNLRFLACGSHGSCGYIDSTHFSATELGIVVSSLQKKVQKMVTQELMAFGANCEQNKKFCSFQADFEIICTKLSDNLQQQAPGFWFPFQSKELSITLGYWLQQIASMIPLTHNNNSHLDNDSAIKEMNNYLEKCEQVQQCLFVMIHLGSGSPTRATEFQSILFSNTPYNMRGLFILPSKQLALIQSYHKGRNIGHGSSKPIVKFPDNITSGLLLSFLLFIRPIQKLFSEKLFPSTYSEVECNSSIFIHNGRAVTAETLRIWFTLIMKKELDKSLTFSAYRQFHTGLLKTFHNAIWESMYTQLDIGPNSNYFMEENPSQGLDMALSQVDLVKINTQWCKKMPLMAMTAMHHQAGHTVNTAHSKYAVSEKDLRDLTAPVLMAFDYCSKTWHRILGLGSGKPTISLGMTNKICNDSAINRIPNSNNYIGSSSEGSISKAHIKENDSESVTKILQNHTNLLNSILERTNILIPPQTQSTCTKEVNQTLNEPKYHEQPAADQLKQAQQPIRTSSKSNQNYIPDVTVGHQNVQPTASIPSNKTSLIKSSESTKQDPSAVHHIYHPKHIPIVTDVENNPLDAIIPETPQNNPPSHKNSLEETEVCTKNISDDQLLQQLRVFLGNPNATFRPFQKLLLSKFINAKTSNDNILAILPTGFGKSLLYLITSVLRPTKVTVVVLPLIALKDDILLRCRKLGIPATNSTNMQDKHYPLVIFSIEKVSSIEYTNFIIRNFREKKLHIIVLDEAHLVVTAKGYREYLNNTRFQIRPEGVDTPLMALTATAPPALQPLITEFCGIRGKRFERIYCSSARQNLSYIWKYCVPKMVPGEVAHIIKKLIKDYHNNWNIGNNNEDKKPPAKFIVYTPTKQTIPCLLTFISNINPGLQCNSYNGDLTTEERTIVYEDFRKCVSNAVMVATQAFGCGVNMQEIRAVIHAYHPNSIIEYAQESGRGGRDNKLSYGIVFDCVPQQPWQKKQADSASHPFWSDSNTAKYGVFPKVEKQFCSGTLCRRIVIENYLNGFKTSSTCLQRNDTYRCDVCMFKLKITTSGELPEFFKRTSWLNLLNFSKRQQGNIKSDKEDSKDESDHNNQLNSRKIQHSPLNKTSMYLENSGFRPSPKHFISFNNYQGEQNCKEIDSTILEQIDSPLGYLNTNIEGALQGTSSSPSFPEQDVGTSSKRKNQNVYHPLKQDQYHSGSVNRYEENDEIHHSNDPINLDKYQMVTADIRYKSEIVDLTQSDDENVSRQRRAIPKLLPSNFPLVPMHKKQKKTVLFDLLVESGHTDMIAISTFFWTKCAPCSYKKRKIITHQIGQDVDGKQDFYQKSCYYRRCYNCASCSHSLKGCRNAYNIVKKGCYKCTIHTHAGKLVHVENTYGSLNCHLKNCIHFAVISWESWSTRMKLFEMIPDMPGTIDDVTDYVNFLCGRYFHDQRQGYLGLLPVCKAIKHLFQNQLM